MKTFPTNFAAQKNLKTGAAPIWMLKLIINSVTYWLSDGVYTIAGWNGGVTTKACISSWGSVSEKISGNIGEILIADLSVTILSDPADSPTFQQLAYLYPLEASPCELYLWFYGLTAATDPPQLMFKGYVKEVDIPDETAIVLDIEDETSRYQAYIGTKVTAEQFPLADPDHIGKLIPIVFGSVTKLPALCVDAGWATTLKIEAGLNDTSISVSDLPPTTVARTIRIDDETIRITAYNSSTKVCTVTRGYGGTTKAVHAKGSTVVEAKATPLVYLLADHSLDAIGSIYARVGSLDIDITTDCTKYLGTAGNQHASYPGRAAVTIANLPAVSKRINLALIDSIGISDTLHTHAAGTVNTTNTVSGSQSSAWTNGTASVNLKGVVPGTYNLYGRALAKSFAAAPGTILSCTITVTVTCPAGSNIYYGGLWVWGPTPAYNNVTLTYKFTAAQASAMAGNTLEIYVYLWSGTISPGYMYTSDYILSASAGASMSRNFTYNSTTSSNVSVAAQSSGVSKSGTVSLSGNSVSDVMIGEMLLVDCTRSSVTSPLQCIDWLLETYAADTTLTQTGTLPSSYAFNGAITEYKRLIDWLDTLAFQAACYFRRLAGVSRLITRYPQPASVRTISACALTDEGIKDMRARKAPISDVINSINLLYKRDWTESGNEAYTLTASAESATSVATFGVREEPSLFEFDFVTSSAMANDLAATYLSMLASRPWQISFAAYLDQSDCEFADVVTLSFLNDAVGRITEVSVEPGSVEQIDTVRISALVTAIPAILATALVTLTGEELVTKTSEELVYV